MSYEKYKQIHLHIDLSRGKPCKEQLDISMPLLNFNDYLSVDGIDCRNYGLLDGTIEAKNLFAEIFECEIDEVFVGGNSSLNLIYSILEIGIIKGEYNQKRKILCPCPGYDRHFKIAEYLGFELIPIKLNEDGPDMDTIEKLVSEDESIKGIFCVPVYSNPDGFVYSNEIVLRFAKLKPKAQDFKILWDNAYMLHHFTEDEVVIPNLLNEAKKYGNENMVYMFFSTSKITFPGGGISSVATSKENIKCLTDNISITRICYDKLNQLRHIKFLKNLDNIKEIMKCHAKIIKPKFDIVFNTLEQNFGKGNENICWTKPKGGYFSSLYLKKGYAKKVAEKCRELGVILTDVGAAFPYGIDKDDTHIRFAPSYASTEEIKIATEVLCEVVKNEVMS
jgi:DNA-binding transcriptional MocR family regulator